MSTFTAEHIDALDRLYTIGDDTDTMAVSHVSPDCPAAEFGVSGRWHAKGDNDGWLCSTCIDVRTVPMPRVATSRADSIDAPERHEGGSGSSKVEEPATEKQLAFLRRLIAEHPATADVENFHLDTIERFSKKMASQAIELLLASPAETGPAEYRWKKIDGDWLVTGPQAEPGSTITIVKASGEKVDARIVRVVRDGLFAVEQVKAEPKAAAGQPATGRSFVATMLSLRDRVVELTGAQTRDRCLRVCVPADVLGVEDQPDAAYRIGWGYGWKGAERHTGGVGTIRTIPVSEASAKKLAEYLLSLSPEEFVATQAAYGQHFHACGRCGSPLTDKDSKARGLGPTCYGASA